MNPALATWVLIYATWVLIYTLSPSTNKPNTAIDDFRCVSTGY